MVNSSFIFFLEKKTYLINWLTISSFPTWSLFYTQTNPFFNLVKLNHTWNLITHFPGCNFVVNQSEKCDHNPEFGLVCRDWGSVCLFVCSPHEGSLPKPSGESAHPARTGYWRGVVLSAADHPISCSSYKLVRFHWSIVFCVRGILWLLILKCWEAIHRWIPFWNFLNQSKFSL